MSAKVSGQVWELDLPPTDKLVLLALADHADHEGKNIRPGNELLCAKTGLSQQRVTQAIANFVKLGVLLPVNRKTGRTHKREFTLNTNPIKKRRYFKDKEEESYADSVPLAQKRHSQSVPLAEERYALREEKVRPESEKVRPESEKVRFQTDAYKEVTVMNHHEPSVEKNEGSSPNSLLTVLLTAYQNIAKSQRELVQVSQQSEALVSDKITVEELTDWLNSSSTYPAPAFIAQTFRRWKVAQEKQRQKNQATAYVGANSANVLLMPKTETKADSSAPVRKERSGTWGSILDRLEATFDEEHKTGFSIWFEPLEELRIDDGVLSLWAPDPVFRSQIENNYASLLYKAIEAEGLSGVVFEFGQQPGMEAAA